MSGHGGPKLCAICDQWPAMETAKGLRCHLCESRDWCLDHPVPMPANPKMRTDIEALNNRAAAELHSRTKP